MLRQDGHVAPGMSAEDGRYAARLAFGGIEQAKERRRDARPFRALDSWWLDFKHGALMLIQYPGLTPAGGFGMAMAVASAAGAVSISWGRFLASSLSVEKGRRVLCTFVTWRRDEARSPSLCWCVGAPPRRSPLASGR